MNPYKYQSTERLNNVKTDTGWHVFKTKYKCSYETVYVFFNYVIHYDTIVHHWFSIGWQVWDTLQHTSFFQTGWFPRTTEWIEITDRESTKNNQTYIYICTFRVVTVNWFHNKKCLTSNFNITYHKKWHSHSFNVKVGGPTANEVYWYVCGTYSGCKNVFYCSGLVYRFPDLGIIIKVHMTGKQYFWNIHLVAHRTSFHKSHILQYIFWILRLWNASEKRMSMRLTYNWNQCICYANSRRCHLNKDVPMHFVDSMLLIWCTVPIHHLIYIRLDKIIFKAIYI